MLRDSEHSENADPELVQWSGHVWLTYSQAEGYTGLDRTTLWRAVRRGDLQVGGVGRAPRFHVDDLDEFMRSGMA